MIYPHGMVRMRVGTQYVTCYPDRDKLLQLATDALIAGREKLRAERPGPSRQRNPIRAKPPVCTTCGGKGIIPDGIGFAPCQKCDGEGTA